MLFVPGQLITFFLFHESNWERKQHQTTFQHGVMRVYFPEPIDLKKMQELSNSSLSFMVVRLL